MSGAKAEEIRGELERLMREQVESLQRQTYLGITEEELQLEKARLQRIRELSADYLEALKKTSP
jgi:hypothetical protein